MKDETVDWFHRALRANNQNVAMIDVPPDFEPGDAFSLPLGGYWHEADVRAALVRAVVARDWAVAMALHDEDTGFFCGFAERRIADLPTPDEFVASLLGEVRE